MSPHFLLAASPRVGCHQPPHCLTAVIQCPKTLVISVVADFSTSPPPLFVVRAAMDPQQLLLPSHRSFPSTAELRGEKEVFVSTVPSVGTKKKKRGPSPSIH